LMVVLQPVDQLREIFVGQLRYGSFNFRNAHKQSLTRRSNVGQRFLKAQASLNLLSAVLFRCKRLL